MKYILIMVAIIIAVVLIIIAAVWIKGIDTMD